MATIQIRITAKNIRQSAVDALVKKLKEKYGEDDDAGNIVVTKVKHAESRADRFQEAIDKVSDAKGEMEELRDELQEWVEGMPENLQSGSKADEVNDAISALEDVIQNCEEVEGAEVSFPGMY